MRADPRWTALTLGLLALVALAGCTRSLEMTYSPALYRVPQADQLKGIVLGVAKPEDRRATVVQADPDNLTYVMRQGAWRFGLTHKGQEFVPVADLVQALFVEEFTRAGVESRPIAKILTKDKLADMRTAGEQAGIPYVLGGRVLVFEITNDVGWTVVSRRSVTLEVTLVRVQSGEIAFDNVVSASNRDESAWGISHASSVDRLMNNAFRQVVTQVVEQVAAKLALDPRDVHVRFAWVTR
jgi:ABC-type uncharacterized transport system auxiliary subunit